MNSRASPLNAAELAQVIAQEIAAQGNDTDNLGDSESICLVGSLPTINLVKLSEKLLVALGLSGACGATLRYVRKAQVADYEALGWIVVADLGDYHGQFSVLMEKRDDAV